MIDIPRVLRLSRRFEPDKLLSFIWPEDFIMNGLEDVLVLIYLDLNSSVMICSDVLILFQGGHDGHHGQAIFASVAVGAFKGLGTLLRYQIERMTISAVLQASDHNFALSGIGICDQNLFLNLERIFLIRLLSLLEY